MRRLLLLTLAAAASATPAAYANPTCTPQVGPTRVCVELRDCPTTCPVDPNADVECTPEQPVSGPCRILNELTF